MGWGLIPDRWEQYRGYSGAIAIKANEPKANDPKGDEKWLRIIPTKCPLDSCFRTNDSWGLMAARTLFTPKPIIINLCATRRYYDPNHYGFDYVFGVPLEGGGAVPSEKQHDQFEELLVDLWFNSAPGTGVVNVIVHCTCGVNRTGLMVAGFLVRVLGFDPERALEIFHNVRGYPVDKPPFITALRAMAKRSSPALRTVPFLAHGARVYIEDLQAEPQAMPEPKPEAMPGAKPKDAPDGKPDGEPDGERDGEPDCEDDGEDEPPTHNKAVCK